MDNTNLASAETVMVHRAPVAFLAVHVRLTDAQAVVVVALFHSAFVAVARLTVLQVHRVPEEPGSAVLTRLAGRVVQTAGALAGDRVARSRIFFVYVAGTLTFLARFSCARDYYVYRTRTSETILKLQ